ncbi:hypothetical protein FALB51S_02595 [Frigidibacter albus]|uniref:Uncharacterized protein n=1 Tax=Frigidibacter mobilis TaxID=1335048 RepID=A0A159Z3U3_9RHOB|nr:hypothetical protein AKL17_1666 [Frigidibacter mobilis]
MARPGLAHAHFQGFRDDTDGIGAAKPMDLQVGVQEAAIGMIARQFDIGPVNAAPEHISVGNSGCLPSLDERCEVSGIGGKLPGLRFG